MNKATHKDFIAPVTDQLQALTHAAEYDRWVRAKVQASRYSTLPAIADLEWQSIRAAKLAQQKALQAHCVAALTASAAAHT